MPMVHDTEIDAVNSIFLAAAATTAAAVQTEYIIEALMNQNKQRNASRRGNRYKTNDTLNSKWMKFHVLSL